MLELLKTIRNHPTAELLYQELKKEIPNISLGTVYRNLNVLIKQGKIKKLTFGNTFDRFEAVIENHYHFICEKCGKVFDISLPIYEDLNKMAMEKSNFTVSNHKLNFYGLCKSCKI